MKTKVAKAVTEYSPSRGICLILAIGMLVWGLWVFAPFDAFTTSSFALMSKLGSEYMWGALMTFGGATLITGVITKDVEWIRRGAFIGFILWAILAVLGTVSDPTATGFAVRGTLAFMHAYMYMQVKLHPELISGTLKIADLQEWVKSRKENTQ